jgi:hypothetical protein
MAFPKLNIPDLDAGLIASNRERESLAMSETPQTIEAQAFQNTDRGQDFSQGDRFNQGLAYGNDALLGAIKTRAMGASDRQMQGIRQKGRELSYEQKFQRLQNAATMTKGELEYNENVRRMKEMEKAHRKQARASTLGNILGIAGGVVGGVFGGPAGAMAGYSVGSGVGQSIGMSK